jgi:signal transduction histidine kinase/ActR/RegA family two-component response regulator
MSIRYRILLIMAAFSIAATSYFLVWRHRMDEGLSRIEKDAVSDQHSLSKRLVELDGKSLETVAFDYTYWNDMVKMVRKPDLNWAKQNLDTCLGTYSLSALWVVNRAGHVQYTVATPQCKELAIPVDLRSLMEQLDKKHFAHGFANSQGRFIEIRAASIHNEKDPGRDGSWYGYFIVAREWDSEKLKHVGQLLDCDLEVVSDGNPNTGLPSSSGDILTTLPATNIHGIPVAFLRFRATRPALAHARTVGSAAPKYIVASCLALVLMTAYFTIIWVLVPLTALSKALRTGNLRHLDGQLDRKGEFGEVARLTQDSFIQKSELEEARHFAEQKNQELAAQAASLEMARDQALDAARAKSAFVAMVSHEIRTPMNGILGMASLMETSDLSTENQERLKTIQHSGNVLLNVINDVLDLAKVDAGRVEIERVEFDLRLIANEVSTLLANQAERKGLAMHVEIDPTLSQFYWGDPTRIRQILINMVGNALKFTEHGSVTIRVECISGANNIEAVRIGVRDTGIGIPKERQGSIFESFSQADSRTTRLYGGTGLGLTLSQQFATLMGSRIQVESELDQGSYFWFDLELEPATGASAQQGSKLRTGALKPQQLFAGTRVLLAEDNSINERVARAMLERLGCDVETAIHGQAAVEACRLRKFDLILMDMNMPVMDGVTAIKIIRGEEQGEPTPILALTANVDSEARSACIEAGATGFLPKPITIDKLGQALQEHCVGELTEAA